MSGFLRADRHLIDTSSLMDDQAAEFFQRHVTPRIEDLKPGITILLQVIRELKKHADDTSRTRESRERRAKAQRALELVERLEKDGVVRVIEGYNSGRKSPFADNDLLSVLTVHSLKYSQCLVTQDRALAEDVFSLNERPSTNSRPITVYRIGKGGQPIPFRRSRSSTGGHPVRTRRRTTKQTTGRTTSVVNRPVRGAFARSVGTPSTDNQEVAARRAYPGQSECVRDTSGEWHQLLSEPKGGGEGYVFFTDTGLACKIFKPERLTVGKLGKLARMLENPVDYRSICWPKMQVTNQHRETVGYLMNRAEGESMKETIFIPPVLRNTFPDWTRRDLVEVMLNVLRAISHLHERNVLIGDINPDNILVRGDCTVSFVDTDSYQVEAYPCPVGSLPFVAPALLDVTEFASVFRTPGQEHFAVSTLVFMTLFTGKAPYSHVDGSDMVTNIRTRHFPYCLGDKKSQGVPLGHWAFVWSHLPYYLKERFHEVFAEGADVSAAEWISLLTRYRNDIANGWLTDEIWPRSFKTLSRHQAIEAGAKWAVCDECGDETAIFGGLPLCSDCAAEPVDVKCFLCDEIRAIRRGKVRHERSKGHNVWCADCAGSEDLACAAPGCPETVELQAWERARLKQRGSSPYCDTHRELGTP